MPGEVSSGGFRAAGACPSEATILAFVEGGLAATQRPLVESHLARCDECRVLISALARSSPEPPTGGPLPPALAVTELPADDSRPLATSKDKAGPVRPGDVLAGKYEVERVIGMGGMGVVVAAKHRELGQLVALKFLLPAAFEAPGAHARFLREARAAARIQSEHVARVTDVGTLETGAPYLVMEHLSGRDLAQALKERGPFEPSLAVELVLQACEAVAEAHSLGIVHRDLKPANLFLTQRADGSPLVKVLDFGISKAEGGSQATLTTQSSMMGSPKYMSPEQLRSTRDVDARTDVWSLGVILFELTSGVTPFRGESIVNVCAAIATDAPPPLRSLCPEAPEALERAIVQALEKDAGARLQSVAALASALEPIASPRARVSIERIFGIGGESARSARTVPPARPRGATRRTGLLVAIACGLVGAGTLVVRAERSTATPTSTPTSTSTSTSTPTPTPTATATATATATSASPPTPSATSTSSVDERAGKVERGLALRVKRRDEAKVAADAGATSHKNITQPSGPVGESGLLDRK